MLGMIFNWLEEFAREKAGPDAWKTLHQAAGLPTRGYFATTSYPDQDLLALVDAASTALGVPSPDLVEEFGVYLVPKLRKIYGHLIRPEWGVFDVVENVNDGIHGVVCSVAPDARPPQVRYERKGDQLSFTYNSPRNLCWLVRGLLRGFADSFGESIRIDHPSCVHLGSSECRFQLVRQG